MLFICIKHPDISAVRADGIELRLDLFPRIDKKEIAALCEKIALPTIFTFKKEKKILFELLDLEPTFVDIEYDTDPAVIQQIAERFPKTKIILSYHNFEETPQNLESILAQMKNAWAYSYKITTMAHSTLDALSMLLFVRAHKEMRLSGICMGNCGQITRILGPVFGNFIDYAIMDTADKTAPGQLTVEELALYSYASLHPKTALYGLIGDPIEMSFSHLSHNPILKHCDGVYVKMQIREDELAAFLPLAKACGFLGLSVTMPLKEKIFPLLLSMHEDARSIGSVNTLLLKEGHYYGHNVDGIGALDAIEEITEVKGKKVILLGAGGAARAIAFEALRRGAEVVIYNRTKERALALAASLGCQGGSLEEVQPDYDIIVNCTCASLPIVLKPKTVAMDIKSLPLMTPFLEEARKKECTLVFGYQMFFNQATEQLRLWLRSDMLHTSNPMEMPAQAIIAPKKPLHPEESMILPRGNPADAAPR